MWAGETILLGPSDPVELPRIKVPACWNTRESLLACPRHRLHPQGRRDGPAGRGVFAAAAAAGALPLGAPWVQSGRTACPRQGSSCSPRQRRHRGCREFSACDRLTALQAEMLEPREGCGERSSSPLLTSSPHVSGAHTAAAGGRWATGFSLRLPSELWACRRTRDSRQRFWLFLSETGFKKFKAFFAERKFGIFVTFFLRGCTYMFIPATWRQETSQKRQGSHDSRSWGLKGKGNVLQDPG